MTRRTGKSRVEGLNLTAKWCGNHQCVHEYRITRAGKRVLVRDRPPRPGEDLGSGPVQPA